MPYDEQNQTRQTIHCTTSEEAGTRLMTQALDAPLNTPCFPGLADNLIFFYAGYFSQNIINRQEFRINKFKIS